MDIRLQKALYSLNIWFSGLAAIGLISFAMKFFEMYLSRWGVIWIILQWHRILKIIPEQIPWKSTITVKIDLLPQTKFLTCKPRNMISRGRNNKVQEKHKYRLVHIGESLLYILGQFELQVSSSSLWISGNCHGLNFLPPTSSAGQISFTIYSLIISSTTLLVRMRCSQWDASCLVLMTWVSQCVLLVWCWSCAKDGVARSVNWGLRLLHRFCLSNVWISKREHAISHSLPSALAWDLSCL